jgi:hypothetical protein
MGKDFKKKKVEKKPYGLSLPKNLVNRLQFIKRLKKSEIDISGEATGYFYKLIEELEKSNGINNQTWLNSKKCPECDSYLILRTGKYGEFYSCHNYPKCKFKETKK